MKKVLSLGGAGAVAEHATRDLVEFSDFEQITIGDYNVEAAEKLKAELKDDRVDVRKIDANNYDDLVKNFKDYDFIINGLPWKYDLPVTKACVEVGVDGLDVSTEEEQWDFHDKAVAKDMLFIPGVGATPGITNAMARRGYDLMDEVDDIQINFAAFRCPAPAPGLLITFLWEFHPKTESRLYYENGAFIWAGPFEGLKMVNFPGQIGEQEVCYIPHPETQTMPKSLGAKNVSVRGCFPPHAMKLAKAMLGAGLYRDDPITVRGVTASPIDLMHDILLELPETKETPLWAYGLVVDVIGKKDDKDIKVTLWNRHPGMDEWGGKAAYYKNIAIPLSIGAQMFAKGEITAKGVLPPESVIDPLIFFAELKKRGIEIHEKIEQ